MFNQYFFTSRRRHTRWPRDWSSDVCSSDLDGRPGGDQPVRGGSLEGDPELLEVDDGVEVPTEGQIAGQGAVAGHVDGPVQGVEIGRASCRERMESVVVYVGLQ